MCQAYSNVLSLATGWTEENALIVCIHNFAVVAGETRLRQKKEEQIQSAISTQHSRMPHALQKPNNPPPLSQIPPSISQSWLSHTCHCSMPSSYFFYVASLPCGYSSGVLLHATRNLGDRNPRIAGEYKTSQRGGVEATCSSFSEPLTHRWQTTIYRTSTWYSTRLARAGRTRHC